MLYAGGLPQARGVFSSPCSFFMFDFCVPSPFSTSAPHTPGFDLCGPTVGLQPFGSACLCGRDLPPLGVGENEVHRYEGTVAADHHHESTAAKHQNPARDDGAAGGPGEGMCEGVQQSHCPCALGHTFSARVVASGQRMRPPSVTGCGSVRWQAAGLCVIFSPARRRVNPPPPTQVTIVGKKRNLQLGKSDRTIFGTQTFAPPPPSPPLRTAGG